jgi:hypothetical protein
LRGIKDRAAGFQDLGFIPAQPCLLAGPRVRISIGSRIDLFIAARTAAL